MEVAAGVGLVGGGAGAAGGGIAGAIPTGGASLLIGAAGGSAVTAGWATVAHGATSVVAGLATIADSMSMMSKGSGISGPQGSAPSANKGLGTPVKKVVNSNMPHAAERAVDRAGFRTIKEARSALQEFGTGIEKHGLPKGAIQDTAHVDRVIVPGFGQGGAVVYQVNDGTLKLKTVLEWKPPQ